MCKIASITNFTFNNITPVKGRVIDISPGGWLRNEMQFFNLLVSCVHENGDSETLTIQPDESLLADAAAKITILEMIPLPQEIPDKI